MSTKKILIAGFLLMALVQWWTPAAMIWGRERVLRDGKAFKFRSAPVDPYDPFRGKYITLRFREERFIAPANEDWSGIQTAYAGIVEDSAGFAKVLSLLKSKPGDDKDFIKVDIDTRYAGHKNEVYIQWPFDRFYMEESKAFPAEQVYNRTLADSSMVAYALVKVKNGEAAIADFFINEKSINSYIKK